MPKTDDNYFQYEYTDNPMCPYCDHIYVIEDDEEFNEITCPQCNKTYDCFAHHVEVTYSTDGKEE
jgi:uncharacterized Zn-finger protein